MKYLSLFSGIGGFEKGIQQAYENLQSGKHISEWGTSGSDSRRLGGESDNIFRQEGRNSQYATCIGFSEIDKYATQIYEKHYKYEQCEVCATKGSEVGGSKENTEGNQGQGLLSTQGENISTEGGQSSEHTRNELNKRQLNCTCKHKNYGDITKINADELPDFDLLVGGFPCQAFSIAGKRKGFEDTRGTLFFEIARILKAKQPRLFCLENVKGLLSHDNGNTFTTIISTLTELGYDLQWQVLNSKNHGVPQNRERVFIIGHLRGTSRPEVFPFIGQSNENTTIGKSAETAVARTLTGGGHTGGNHSGMTILQIGTRKDSNSGTQPFQQDRVYDTTGISPALQQGLPEGGHKIKDAMRIRRLTPTECERLQGFPDGWTKGVSDTQRYKTLGNAVSVNVIQDIMEKLL